MSAAHAVMPLHAEAGAVIGSTCWCADAAAVRSAAPMHCGVRHHTKQRARAPRVSHALADVAACERHGDVCVAVSDLLLLRMRVLGGELARGGVVARRTDTHLRTHLLAGTPLQGFATRRGQTMQSLSCGVAVVCAHWCRQHCCGAHARTTAQRALAAASLQLHVCECMHSDDALKRSVQTLLLSHAASTLHPHMLLHCSAATSTAPPHTTLAAAGGPAAGGGGFAEARRVHANLHGPAVRGSQSQHAIPPCLCTSQRTPRQRESALV
jgi:hypothetical protein